MKSKISLFNLGLIKQDMKQHGWISIIYFLGLIFAMPLQMFFIDSEEYRRFEHINNFFQIGMEFQAFFLCTVPIATGILLFRYLQAKESADMIHSLPIKRGALYFNHLLSGLIMLLVPVLITAVITWFVRNSVSYASVLSGEELFIWLGVFSLFTICFFIVSVFLGMISGMSVAQGILTYIFLFLPTGLLLLLNYQFEQFLYGFSQSLDKYEELSPIIRFVSSGDGVYTWGEIGWYVLVIAVLAIGSWLIYRARHIESATQVISFPILKPIFKYGVTFCSMLVSGSYFVSMQNGSHTWLYIGYAIGAVLGFTIAEMILQKTWRIFSMKLAAQFAGYAVIAILLVVVVKVDLFNYEAKVPEQDVIEGVYYGYNVYDMYEMERNGEVPFSDNEQYINNIQKLHETIVETKPEISRNEFDAQHFVIAYKLKGDEMLIREYSVPTAVVSKQLKPVLESEPYKYGHFKFQTMDKDVDRIVIYPSEGGKKGAIITDPAEMKELKQILKQEIMALRYEDMVNGERSWANIEFVIEDQQDEWGNQIHAQMYDWKKTYDTLESWLKEKGYFADVRVLPEDIQSIEVMKDENAKDYYYSPHEVFKRNGKTEGIKKFDNEQLIEEALEQSAQYGAGKYFVKFNMKRGESFFGVFTKEHLPNFVKTSL